MRSSSARQATVADQIGDGDRCKLSGFGHGRAVACWGNKSRAPLAGAFRAPFPTIVAGHRAPGARFGLRGVRPVRTAARGQGQEAFTRGTDGAVLTAWQHERAYEADARADCDRAAMNEHDP